LRRLYINQLKPGMVVARPVYSSNGFLLVNRGAVLTSGIIERLSALEVPALYVEDGLPVELPYEEVISEETRLKAIQQVKDLLTSSADEGRALCRALVQVERIARTVEEMIDELLANRNVVVNLTDIRAWDDYTFGHCVNVGVLSLMTGLSLGLPRSELRQLGLGAILHDLGKVKVPQGILKKPGPLDPQEFSLVQKHTEWGHQMVRELVEVSPLAAVIPLEHHERYQGQGYPRGLRDGEIHPFAAICGLADVFDALTSDRVYRRAVPVHEAYEYLSASGDYLFAYPLVQAFLENLALYPTGTLVRLSTGEVAVVVKTLRGLPRHPLVTVVQDAEGRNIEPYDLDLSQHPSVVITEVLSPDP
jgi:HD-GYP domain-containing protein (c-di-GMP phosphodiesterase class II)